MEKLFNKEVGRAVQIGTFGFIWGDETRFTMRKYDCEDCNKEVVGFNVDLANDRVKDTIFCSECFGILDKPEVWGRFAIKGTPVNIEYSNGKVEEKFTGDFLPLLKKIKDTTLFHCNEPMELTGFIDKSDDVYEHYFECPECLMEKLIKSFK